MTSNWQGLSEAGGSIACNDCCVAYVRFGSVCGQLHEASLESDLKTIRQDIADMHYFWTQKEDLTRWVDWESRKTRYPAILGAWQDLEQAKAELTHQLELLARRYPDPDYPDEAV